MIQTYALRGRPVPAKNGLWVHVNDCTRLKLERAYAQDSLDAAKAEIARLTAEGDKWREMYEAERDQNLNHVKVIAAHDAEHDRQLALARAEGMRIAAEIAEHERDYAGRDQDGEYYCGEEAAIWGGQIANGIAAAILSRAKDMEAGNG